MSGAARSINFSAPTANRITATVHGPPDPNRAWDTYVVRAEYEQANTAFRRFTAERERRMGSARASASTATIVASATPAERAALIDRGRMAADGCPIGVGAYGFEQMPGLLGTVVVDGNRTAVVALMNMDYANRYEANDLAAWDAIRRRVPRPATRFGMRGGYELCPRYAGNMRGTRRAFAGGQSGFACRWADGSVTRPRDAAPSEVTCTTVLTVWCPIPPAAQRRLRAGRVLRHGVQLLSEHADMLPPPSGRGVAGAPGGTVYPVAHLCPQPPPVPPVSVAACSYYDPRVDSAARCAAAEKSSGADLHA